MILLAQNTVNTSIFTLREKVTIDSPFYLFEVTGEGSKEVKYFTGTDVSTNTNRYNEFNIELTTGVEDLEDAVINLLIKGFYSYKIYSQVTEGNLDPDNVTELVETGIMYVSDEVTPEKTVYGDGKTEKIVYNG